MANFGRWQEIVEEEIILCCSCANIYLVKSGVINCVDGFPTCHHPRASNKDEI